MTKNKTTNIKLGLQPIGNRFLYKSVKKPLCFDMEFIWNNDLNCMSLKKPFPVKELKPKFDWITCFEPEDHLDELSILISKLNNINHNSIIGGFSFKDDTTITRLNKIGYKNTWRIDPNSDLGINDPITSIETFQSKFNKNISNKIILKNQKSDIFIARHVIEHSYNISEFIQTCQSFVKNNGYIIFELPDCERAMRAGDCTILWEEHVNYFTENSFKNLVKKFDLDIVFWKSYKYPLENSILVILKNNSLKDNILKKNIIEIDEIEIFLTFKEKLFQRKLEIYEKLLNFKKNIGPIVLLGAGHLSSTFISVNGLENIIDFIIDDNHFKNKMFMPNGKQRILSSQSLDLNNYKLCLLGTNPQHHKNIIQKHNDFIENGGIMKSIFVGTEHDICEFL
jgi:hypothetical protein